jgi:hypothetical protein
MSSNKATREKSVSGVTVSRSRRSQGAVIVEVDGEETQVEVNESVTTLKGFVVDEAVDGIVGVHELVIKLEVAKF